MRRSAVLILSVLVLILAFAGPAAAQEQGGTIHIVAPGENLFRISLRYNVTIAAIASANNISNTNVIYVGQRLVIPGATGTPPPAQPPAQPPTTPAPSTYVVARGDTLGRIAQRFNTTVQAIATANGIANPNLIFVGQQLTIPGGTGTPTTPPVTQPSQPPSAPVAGGFELGGHVDSFAYPSQMRGAGMTWAKRQIRWSQGQPASIAQGAIDQARANGFRILLGVVGGP